MKGFIFTLVIFILSVFNTTYSFERFVIFELMTSTTCTPCASQNPIFDNWLKNYSLNNRVAVIKYHTWWPSPGNDPYYALNITENQARTIYYQPVATNRSVPRASVNGIDFLYTATNWISGIQSQITQTTPFLVNIEYSSITPGQNSPVTIKVTTENTTLPAGTYVLHLVAVESDLKYTGTNGDPTHHFTMRKMYPDHNGEVFTIQPGETKTFSKSINWNSSWNLNNGHLVAFVQIQETKAVQQATMIKTNLTNLSQSVNTQSGWNIVSIPLSAIDMNVTSIFSNATSQAYEYTNSYVPVTTFQNKKGYWLKFDSPGTYPVLGSQVTSRNVPVKSGWNMIGTFENNLHTSLVTTNPAGIVVSSYFEADNGYKAADTLKAGKGYWVKVNQDGELILPLPVMKPESVFPFIRYRNDIPQVSGSCKLD